MPDFKTVLAIDTSLNGCGGGMYQAGTEQKHFFSEAMTTGQSERLIPLIQDLVKNNAESFAGLDAVVVTTGPGAFTGIRIGMSAAKSFSLALGIPIAGLTSLQALALTYAPHATENFAVLIDSKRDDFYIQSFSNAGGALDEARSVSGQDAIGIINDCKVCIGNGIERLAQSYKGACILKGDFDLPDCGLIAKYFSEVGYGRIFTNVIDPLYLRPADTSISNKVQRQLQS